VQSGRAGYSHRRERGIEFASLKCSGEFYKIGTVCMQRPIYFAFLASGQGKGRMPARRDIGQSEALQEPKNERSRNFIVARGA
jgi:hypothetical protein